MSKAKPLLKLALTLSTAALFIGRISYVVKAKTGDTTAATLQPALTIPTSLKAAIEELRVMQIKVEDETGINPKEYREDLDDLVNIVKNAYGNPEALAAVKSSVEGHKLAKAFWHCDRLEGYNELHQCRDKVLKSVFAKYPDIEAQAKSAVEGENLAFISAGLDKDAVLQAIWEKTGKDTTAALQSVNPTASPM